MIDAKFLLLQLLNSGDRQAVIEAYRLIYHTGKLVADVNNEIELLAKEWQILLAYKPFFQPLGSWHYSLMNYVADLWHHSTSRI